MNVPAPPPPAEPPRSPCTSMCRLDERGRHCVGCRRTIDEIVGWPRMGEAEQRAVLAALPRRRIAGD